MYNRNFNGKYNPKTYGPQLPQQSASRSNMNGCKEKINKNGDTNYIAFNIQKKRGVISAIASQCHHTNKSETVRKGFIENKNGARSRMWLVSITNKTTLAKTLHTGFQKEGSSVINIPDIGMYMCSKRNQFVNIGKK
jgi:hypothetical protein